MTKISIEEAEILLLYVWVGVFAYIINSEIVQH